MEKSESYPAENVMGKGKERNINMCVFINSDLV